MANCMTCRHNDKKAKYCPVKKAHTDLGYVLNCIAWAPTDEAEMKRFRAENAKLRELVRDAHALATDHGVDVRYPYCHAWDEKLAVVEEQMRELGMETDG